MVATASWDIAKVWFGKQSKSGQIIYDLLIVPVVTYFMGLGGNKRSNSHPFPHSQQLFLPKNLMDDSMHCPPSVVPSC
jgi:hypothetical protein